MTQKLILVILCALLAGKTYTQDQPPPDDNRKEIETRHARIIFSEEITDYAKKAAYIVDSLYNAQSTSLNAFPKQVPIILYNNTVVSNGYAALYPRRSAWFTTGMQDPTILGNSDWLTVLGIHEFRHIVQYAKYDKHFTRFLSRVFGEPGIVMGRYSIPFWFAEGDAITTETAHTIGGRGRVPKFEMNTKAILLNDIKYKYPKAKLGSYKDYYPNHYYMGWLLVSYARMKYGQDVWDKTLDHTAKISFWPYAFSRGLKKHTGLNERQLYQEAMNYYDSVWTAQNASREFSEYEIISPEVKVYTNFTEADYTQNNNLVYLKADLKDIKHFVLQKPKGNFKKLYPTTAEMFSSEAGKICYAELFIDNRYNHLSYSDVIIYDIEADELKRITKNQKYFAPALSPDGKKIALIEHNEKMKSRLLLIDAETGAEIQSFQNPNNDFLRTPVWNPAGDKIAYTANKNNGMLLLITDINFEKTDTIIEHTTEVIGRPAFFENYLLYNSNYDGIGNIYAVNIKNKTQHRVSSVPFGAYNPKVRGDTLLFEYYTQEGTKIAAANLSPNDWKNKHTIAAHTSKQVEALREQENHVRLVDYKGIEDSSYKVQDYRPMRDAIKIYAWGFYSDFDSEISFELASNNLLNTVRGSAGVTYNVNENTFGTSVNAQFAKYKPIFRLYGGFYQRYVNDPTNDYVETWDEIRSGAAVRLPYRIKNGAWNSSIEPELDFGLRSVSGKSMRYISELGNGSFLSNHYSLLWYYMRRQAHRDIYPKWGTVVQSGYRHLPFTDKYRAYQYYAIGRQYLPGIIPNHSLMLNAAYESQAKPNDDYASFYWYHSPVRFARGHVPMPFTDMYKLTAEYHLPLWYPDIALGPVIYFKRLRTGLFYDYLSLKSFEENSRDFHSAGIELHLQFAAFNLQQDLEIGGRASYLFNNEIPHFELIIGGFLF